MCLVRVREEEDVTVPYRVHAHTSTTYKERDRYARVAAPQTSSYDNRRYSATIVERTPSKAALPLPAPSTVPIPAPQPVPVFVAPPSPSLHGHSHSRHSVASPRGSFAGSRRGMSEVYIDESPGSSGDFVRVPSRHGRSPVDENVHLRHDIHVHHHGSSRSRSRRSRSHHRSSRSRARSRSRSSSSSPSRGGAPERHLPAQFRGGDKDFYYREREREYSRRRDDDSDGGGYETFRYVDARSPQSERFIEGGRGGGGTWEGADGRRSWSGRGEGRHEEFRYVR